MVAREVHEDATKLVRRLEVLDGFGEGVLCSVHVAKKCTWARGARISLTRCFQDEWCCGGIAEDIRFGSNICASRGGCATHYEGFGKRSAPWDVQQRRRSEITTVAAFGVLAFMYDSAQVVHMTIYVLRESQ